VKYDERIFGSRRYLAGSDEARAMELARYFDDPGVNAIVALRGGYGCSRLIRLLDEKLLRRNPKIFMGFSDITTLHLFFRRRFGWITFHGPMAATLSKMSVEQANHLISLWTDPDHLARFSFPQLTTYVPGIAEGRLVGGCLSLVVASLGTAYEINLDGKILFLEDLGEPPYRLDRMLTQLELAGKLDSVAGFLLGAFEECAPSQGDYTAAEILREFVERIGVPVLADFPAGHGKENWALPLGAKIRMDAECRQVEFLEPSVSRRQ
jgi:muramoyltetrapeptide carboxypeptidase